MRGRTRNVCLLMLTSVLGSLLPSTALAQFRWRALSTPGYAVAGMSAAAGPAFATNSIESGVTVLAAGLVGGTVVGWMIGDAAEERLARGESLSGWHRNALRAGTVMAGAGAGALASFMVINGDERAGESSPNDGRTFGSLVAAGAAMGILTQVLLESRLDPHSAGGGLALKPDGRTQVAMTLRF